MDPYTGFADLYDLFMDNIPYEDWSGYLAGLLREYGIEDGLVLDLGCGTGTMTRLLAARGYDMIGVDLSGEMLEVAMERQQEAMERQETAVERQQAGQAGTGREEAGSPTAGILYLQQDMREFELYGTVRAIVSVCDSMNYLTEYGDLVQVLKLANNYLDPGGVFIFDMNTVYKYREELGDSTIAENREEGSFIWENYYDGEDQMNEYDLTLFIREEDGRYRKYEETHFQKAYGLDVVKAAIAEAGMELVAVYDGFTKDAPRPDSGRVCFVAREQGKTEQGKTGGRIR